MPLYEYECESCGHRFERIQKFSDPKVEICPTCGGKVRKLISSPAFQFKGSGFYITDYPKSESGRSGDKGSDKASDKGGADKSGDAPSDKGGKGASKDSPSPAGTSESKPSTSSDSGGGTSGGGGSSAPKTAPKKD